MFQGYVGKFLDKSVGFPLKKDSCLKYFLEARSFKNICIARPRCSFTLDVQ